MKKIRFVFSIAAVAIALVAFTSMASRSGNELPLSKEYDLTKFGVPVTVPGPDGAEVKQGMVHGEIDGQTIYSADIVKDRFLLMVSMWDYEPEETLEEALAYQKSVEEEDESFKGYILSEENGYIAKKISDGETDYDFCYILEKGGRHIQFGIAFTIKEFTEAEIKVLYAAAKAAH